MLIREAQCVLSVPARPARARDKVDPTDRVEISGQTVPVAHQRELRGAWVASVWNINFPGEPGQPAEQQKFELTAMLDRLKDCGFNAVFFQVRPEGDALYRSENEPWSAWLTGEQGRSPGYDPLEFLIGEAHARNIEVHAWLNPYRAQSGPQQRVAPHIAVEEPEQVHPYGSLKWMDPGAEIVRERLVDVAQDLTRRYDLDGIHFDDYFYPYPLNGVDFSDEKSYSDYQLFGGTLSRADWRRENVNQAVRETAEGVRAVKDHVRFGISPFGLPAPERPEGVSGFDQYEGLYADTQKWMDRGWVDYLAPQLYWPTSSTRQPYETLLSWWADHAREGHYVFAGNDLTSLGKNERWTVDEFREQVEICRSRAEQGSQGNIWYNVGPLMENRQGIADVFQDELYARPALTPPLAGAAGRQVAAPEVRVEGGALQLVHRDDAPLRAWTVYRREGDRWELDRVLPGEKTTLELPAGEWAIAAATKHGNESQGVVVSRKRATTEMATSRQPAFMGCQS